MIKIERNNISVIADAFYDFVKDKIEEGDTESQQYYYAHKRDFILCGVADFTAKQAEFERECSMDWQNYQNTLRQYETCHDKVQKTKLKEQLNDSGFAKFTRYMENSYKSIFQKIISDTGAKSGRAKFGIWLARQLDIKTCPYCNRQYTFTIDDDCTIRPEFDHFHPKSVYPYFALSFYNLIPSCPICNHVKKEKGIDLNPYKEGFGNNHKFQIDLNEFVTKSQVSSVGFSNTNQNITVLGLEELYNEHLDYINEILFKARAYNNDYYESLIESFQSLSARPEEINRYIWGCYLETAEHGKRPLSKLTKDLLEQLGIETL